MTRKYIPKYSFPYSTNPLCKDCDFLHIDYEEDNIKKWCDNKDCLVLNTYQGQGINA